MKNVRKLFLVGDLKNLKKTSSEWWYLRIQKKMKRRNHRKAVQTKNQTKKCKYEDKGT